jgi:hypothetical protein
MTREEYTFCTNCQTYKPATLFTTIPVFQSELASGSSTCDQFAFAFKSVCLACVNKFQLTQASLDPPEQGSSTDG